MDGLRIPKIVFEYNLKGRRDVRHPRETGIVKSIMMMLQEVIFYCISN